MKKNTYLPSKRSKIDPFLVMDVLQQSKLLEERGKRIFHLELGEPVNETPLSVQNEAKILIIELRLRTLNKDRQDHYIIQIHQKYFPQEI